MKRLLFLLLVFVCSVSYGQTYQSMPQAGYGPVQRMLFDSVVTLPMGITRLRNISGGRDTAQIRYNKADSSIYVYTGSQWVKSSGSGSTIDTTSLSNRINAKLSASDSTIYYTKFRSDSSRTNIYSAIGGKLNIVDTINQFVSSVSQPNDSSLTFVKGSTASTYIIRSSIAESATRMVTSVYNKSGATILKGAVVYIDGAHSSILPSIALSKANIEETSAYTYGVVDADIPNNSQGVVVQIGVVTGLNLPTSSYTDGQTLYLSPTVAGGYTTTKPLAPNHYVAIGTVIRAHPNQGTIQVAIRNGFQLDEMSDVQIPLVPNDSTVLQFSRVDSLWHAVSPTNVIGGYGWKTSGNSDVNAGRFIGSTNNASLRFRTNNTERMMLDSTGRLLVDSLTVGRGGGRVLSNVAFGLNALINNVSGTSNAALGNFSLQANTVSDNTGAGAYSLYTNTTGNQNTGVGTNALYNNLTGTQNTSLGYNSGYGVGGNYNTSIGANSMYSNGSASFNTSVGASSLYGNASGVYNTAIGSQAGQYYSGLTSMTRADSSIFIGSLSKPNSINQNNQIVIGVNAVGVGSNSVVLGNDNITTTALKGSVGIGTTSPAASSLVDMTSTTKGLLIPRMTTTQRNAISSPSVGLKVYDLTDSSNYTHDGTRWNRQLSANGLQTITGTSQGGSSANGILSLAQTWNTTGNPTALLMNVTNTASGATSKLIDLQVGGTSQFNVSKGGLLTVSNGGTFGTGNVVAQTFTISNNLPFNFSTNVVYNASGTPPVAQVTSGNKASFNEAVNFAPTSGTCVYSAFQTTQTINQTGGANGITRGLYIAPTLTAAVDFRGIEVTNGSVAFPYTAQSATYAIKNNDYTINCTANTFTATLPTAVGCTGRIYTIVNSGAGTITIGTTSSQTFANVATTPTTLTMATVGTRVVQSNGANWLLISSL